MQTKIKFNTLKPRNYLQPVTNFAINSFFLSRQKIMSFISMVKPHLISQCNFESVDSRGPLGNEDGQFFKLVGIQIFQHQMSSDG